MISIFAAALLTAAGADAPKVKHNVAMKGSGAVRLDPNAGYILVRTGSGTASPLAFIRRPDAEEMADYKSRRSEALTRAHAKWVKAHKRWVTEARMWDRAAPEERIEARPEEPVEPNDLNLAFPSIDQENLFSFGPLNRFDKTSDSDQSIYLTQVKPGRYAFYGPLTYLVGSPALGTCVCMGSVEFEVPPGVVTDAGTLRLNYAERMSGKLGPKPSDELDMPAGVTTVGWDPATAGAATDPRLASYRVVPAKLSPAGPFSNFLGVKIDRMTPISGVLRYERDKIVADGVTETAAASH